MRLRAIFPILLLLTPLALGQGTVPTFRHGSFTLAGRDPAQGGTTSIPTVVVPVKLTFAAKNFTMDAGAIAAQEWVFVKKGETARELWERALAPLGQKLLADVIIHAKIHNSLPATPQDEEFATKAPSLSDAKH
jgi:hypothetical protein